MSETFFTKSGSSPGAKSADLLFENHFSLYLIRAVSPAGQTWLLENVGNDLGRRSCVRVAFRRTHLSRGD